MSQKIQPMRKNGNGSKQTKNDTIETMGFRMIILQHKYGAIKYLTFIPICRNTDLLFILSNLFQD